MTKYVETLKTGCHRRGQLNDGPLLRVTTPTQGIAFAKDLEGLSVPELDSLIHRLRDYSSTRGEAVE